MHQFSRQNVCIIGTCFHSFAGGGKNKTRVLYSLARHGYDVHYVGSRTPHFYDGLRDNPVSVHLTGIPHSNVIQTDALEQFAISEKMTDVATESLNRGKRIILWGSNLFPFVESAFAAKENLVITKHCRPALISSPVGSDIWQIGPCVPHNTRRLLYSGSVDAVVTYHHKFADEIRIRFGYQRDIDIVPPIIDSKFQPASESERTLLRESVGISRDDFVITHHSSMRPIKRPEDVISVAERVAAKCNARVVLVMMGPFPKVSQLNMYLPKSLHFEDPDEAPFIFDEANFRILWTGLIKNVERFVKLSDVELNCSLHDSFNISLLEAAACGIPCVTSDVVGIADTIIAAQSGFLFPIKNYNLLTLHEVVKDHNNYNFSSELDDAAEKVLILAKDLALGREMGQRGASFVHDQFSENKILAHYERLFEKILDVKINRN